MTLTLEDWILWVAGFVGVVLLLALLIWRGGAKVFPWLAASCAYQIVQSVTLYLIHLKGPYKVYFWTYWYGRIPEHFLVLSVIWNLGFVLLHPKEHWKARSKEVLAIGGGIALMAAIVLTWMSEPQSAVAMTRFLIRTNLFASILTTELAATVILTALVLKGGWTSGATTLTMGARRLEKASSATIAEISAAAPQVLCAGSAMTNRPVLATESKMASLSRGTSVRGSMTSTSIPSPARLSAARSAAATASPIATTVTPAENSPILRSVDAVCEVPFGSYPGNMPYEYFSDEAHLGRWLEVEADLAAYQDFLGHYIYGVPDFNAYLQQCGGMVRMQELRRQEFLLDRGQ